jgi:hypothetical protein
MSLIISIKMLYDVKMLEEYDTGELQPSSWFMK